jgi:hypothetical protein
VQTNVSTLPFVFCTHVAYSLVSKFTRYAQHSSECFLRKPRAATRSKRASGVACNVYNEPTFPHEMYEDTKNTGTGERKRTSAGAMVSGAAFMCDGKRRA